MLSLLPVGPQSFFWHRVLVLHSFHGIHDLFIPCLLKLVVLVVDTGFSLKYTLLDPET